MPKPGMWIGWVAFLLLLLVVNSYALKSDLDRNGVVDFTDFLLFAAEFGKMGEPEPPDTVTVHDTLTVTV